MQGTGHPGLPAGSTRELGQGRGLERRAQECLFIPTEHLNSLRVSPTLFWVLKAQKNETTPRIRQTGDLVLHVYSACYLTKVGDSNSRHPNFWIWLYYGNETENPAFDSISVGLYLKLLKRGYTLYVTDGRLSLHTAKLRFLDQGRELERGFSDY